MVFQNGHLLATEEAKKKQAKVYLDIVLFLGKCEMKKSILDVVNVLKGHHL